MHRGLRADLAAGDRARRRRAGRQRHARHDYPGLPDHPGHETATKQTTYDGHPVYTYTADSGPGQANGNGLNVDGGVWHEVTASGQAAPAGTPGGDGIGY